MIPDPPVVWLHQYAVEYKISAGGMAPAIIGVPLPQLPSAFQNRTSSLRGFDADLRLRPLVFNPI